MKYLVAASALLGYSVLASGIEPLPASVENDTLKKENQALKAEVAALRRQLSHKDESAGTSDKPVVAAAKTSDEPQMLNSSPSAQGANVDYKINDDLRVSFGTKLWINKWEKFFPDASNTAVYVNESDTTLTPIPTVSIKYKDFFVAGSYFSESDYRWSSSVILPVGTGGGFDGAVVTANTEGSRREYDVTVGYFVHPNLAVTAGYKDILQSFNTQSYLGNAVVYNSNVEVSYQGAILGLVGSVPIGNGFGLYGNFAYGWLDGNFGGYAGINNRDANYVLADGGIAYSYSLRNVSALPMSLSAFAGYRYQSIEVNRLGGTNSNANDYTKGFVTGINMTF